MITGGCGFVGSHVALALLSAGHEPILLDNFSNSLPSVTDRLAAIAGRPLTTIVCDIRDGRGLSAILSAQRVAAVVHCAARKAVAESVAQPLVYHSHNVAGLLTLLEAMDRQGVRSIVFSSSASVYGDPQSLPITEEQATRAVSPYAQTKLIGEAILSDLARFGAGWRVSLLRYFNPIGAHPSGLIGDDPRGSANNIMPIIARVARGDMPHVEICGTDFPTADGTAVRDYIHVLDLAEGHVAALEALAPGPSLQTYNLGTGCGTSVMQLFAAFQRATGVILPCVAVGRRPGDVPELYAAVDKARAELGWSASRSLEMMCADSWRFAWGRMCHGSASAEDQCAPIIVPAAPSSRSLVGIGTS